MNNSILKKIKEKTYLYGILNNVKIYYSYILNRITNYKFLKKWFYNRHGYPLNFKNPKTFNEKIFWKKIYDRNPLLSVTADKYLVRTYVEESLGEETARNILIPQLYVTDEPKTIPFETIPLPFIIKPNHASGRHIIVRNDNYNKKEIIKTCWNWLKMPYGLEKMEWAYRPIKRKIIIEKLLQDEEGNIPIDFKFHMFHGKCKIVRVFFNRMTNRSSSSFDCHWNFIPDIRFNHHSGAIIEKPKNYETMLDYAEQLSQPFDYVRVDLYNINGQIYFGELTHYPKSGNIKFDSVIDDFELGKYWHIKPEYWQKDKSTV